jgi:hypothetical protein
MTKEMVVICAQASDINIDQGSRLDLTLGRFTALAALQILEIAHWNHAPNSDIGGKTLLTGAVKQNSFRILLCPINQGMRNPFFAGLSGRRRLDGQVVMRVTSIRLALGEFQRIHDSDLLL